MISRDQTLADLKDRLGPGARYDANDAPHDELGMARRGTAYFARLLNGLTDGELVAPSRRPGWTKAQLVAFVGYHARSLAQFVEAIRIGSAQPHFPSDLSQLPEVAQGATLPGRALRHLFDHAHIHLNVEWRDLTNEQWDECRLRDDGVALGIRQTPLMHATELWLGALDLDAGGRDADLPTQFRNIKRPCLEDS